MKLAWVTVRDKHGSHATSMYKAGDRWDIRLEPGMVVVTDKASSKRMITPFSNCCWGELVDEEPKRGAK